MFISSTAAPSIMTMMVLGDLQGSRQPWTSVVLKSLDRPCPNILAVSTQPRLGRYQARMVVQVGRPGQRVSRGWNQTFSLLTCAELLPRRGLSSIFSPSSNFHKDPRWPGGEPSWVLFQEKQNCYPILATLCECITTLLIPNV